MYSLSTWSRYVVVDDVVVVMAVILVNPFFCDNIPSDQVEEKMKVMMALYESYMKKWRRKNNNDNNNKKMSPLASAAVFTRYRWQRIGQSG